MGCIINMSIRVTLLYYLVGVCGIIETKMLLVGIVLQVVFC